MKNMPKKNIIGILLVLTLASTIATIITASPVFAMEPAKLKIYAGPTSVPANNDIYDCIFVQLQDTNSRPARAVEDTIISLSSSLTSVGAVDPTVTISKGNTYAVAKFDTTFTPGVTTIAATASGYGTVQTSLSTVGPVPSTLSVYAFPPTLPADGNAYSAIIVQLQDSAGNPARAPLEGLTVSLTCSNTTVGTIPSSVTIQGGNSYAVADFQTNPLAAIEPGVYKGTAEVIAIAQGYSSKQTTIRTQVTSSDPTALKVYVGPQKIMADNIPYERLIAVQLLNNAGVISKISSDVVVNIASSKPEIGTLSPMITIPANYNYGFGTFTSTYQSGSTTITAGASGFASSTATLSTIGPVPTKLAVYCSPSTLPADNQAYNIIQVQLQDSSGKPALDPNGDVTVSLFSSEPTVGTVPTTVTIPYGKTYIVSIYTSTYVGSTTSITAQASGYTTGQAQMRTYLIDMSSLTVAIITDPTTVLSGKQTNITAYVTDPGGNPTSDATVKFTSSAGGVFTTVKSLGNGYYTSMLTAPNLDIPTEVTITATVSRIDYTTSTATAQISVAPPIEYGTLQICVKDDAGQPISNATVSTLSQPSVMANLTGTTNSTGYATFANAAEGNYTFNISKQGYVPMNMTYKFNATSPAKTLYLTKSANDQPVDLTFVWVTIIIAVIAIAVVVFVLKRLKTPKPQAELPP